jgi:hypothetical protein
MRLRSVFGAGLAGLVLASALILVAGKAFMGKMCLFSEVKGKVLINGQPVQGAVVEREFRWAWKGEVGKDSVTTGRDGDFTLPAIYRSSLFGSMLPHEPMVRQTILIKNGAQTYKAWLFDKGNYDENGELNGKPIVLSCSLQNEPKQTGEVFGICDFS